MQLGYNVTAVPPQERGVGLVFQHYAPFKHMTVWDNVAFGLQIRRRPKAAGSPPARALDPDTLIERLAGIEMVHVPYKGSTPGLQAIIMHGWARWRWDAPGSTWVWRAVRRGDHQQRTRRARPSTPSRRCSCARRHGSRS